MQSLFLSVLFSFCIVSLLHAEIPADVQNLIQSEKFPEALTRVDALLKEKPDDAELQKIRADIVAQTPKPAGSATASYTAKKVSGEDRLGAHRLFLNHHHQLSQSISRHPAFPYEQN